MKRIIALIAALAMLIAVAGTLAEAAEAGRMAPLYATVGEAMAACDESRRIAGGVRGEYFAVVTEKDGKYYRSVALYDEKLAELEAAVDSLDYEAADFFEKHEAAMNAMEEYLKTLPIAYSEEFTAQPLTEAEMAAMVGKTLGQLTEEGFEIGSYGTEPGEGEEPNIVFSMRYGVYDYSCLADTDFDSFMTAQDNDTISELKVKAVTLAGITEWGYEKRFHTDGTVEEQEDPFAAFGEIMTEILGLAEKAKAGEEINLEEFAAGLKEKYPDYAEMIDMYLEMYKAYGAEGFVSLMTPAE